MTGAGSDSSHYSRYRSPVRNQEKTLRVLPAALRLFLQPRRGTRYFFASFFDCEIISSPRLGDRVGDGVARLKLAFDSVVGTRRASALGLRYIGRGPARL